MITFLIYYSECQKDAIIFSSTFDCGVNCGQNVGFNFSFVIFSSAIIVRFNSSVFNVSEGLTCQLGSSNIEKD